MPSTKIKILTCYHKPAELIRSDIVTPIYAGRALMESKGISAEDQSWILQHTAGDDTGENISELNPYYSELTVLYWAWKNLDKIDNPDYIGLMHYRRWFIFDNEKDIPEQKKRMEGKGWSPGCLSCSTAEEAKHFLGSDEKIRNAVITYDIILPHYVNVKTIGANRVRDIHDYLGFKKTDSELLYNTIESYYAGSPHWGKITKYLNGYHVALANMSVLKKDIFIEYCEFLFPILNTLREKFDYNYRSVNGNRFLGYCSEIILGIFLCTKQNLKICHKNVSFLLDTEIHSPLNPIFDANAAVIGVASDNKYAPYLAVYLQSIIDTASPEHDYDIIVMENDIEERKKSALLKMVQNFSNISLRFLNPEYLLGKFPFHIKGSYHRSGFYRMALPMILQQYRKVLYTDIDMIFKRDPFELFSNDIEGFPLGACQDIIYGSYLNYNPSFIEYARSILNLSNPYNYYNAGMLLINIPEWLKDNRCWALIEDASSHKYMIDDQDAINKFFKDKIVYLDPKWNVHIISPHLYHLQDFMPLEHLKKFKQSSKEPGLLHWAAREKPWNHPQTDRAEEWWSLAQKTPFYEQILYLNILNKTKGERKPLKHYIKMALKKIIKSQRLKNILKNIYFGCKKIIIRLKGYLEK